MATLALSAAGAALGSTLLAEGVSVLGVTLSGATLGAQAGALAGAFVDQALFASSGRVQAVTGPRLSDLQVTTSTEGAPIPRLFGRARLGGQVIWAPPIEEAATTEGGGSAKGTGAASAASTTSFAYFASFAVAICEGPVTTLGRVWANGQELDLTQYVYRFYRGTETQAADSLVSALEGIDRAPAYRGVAYIVFERMPLAAFGNRLPQLSFEVHRSVDALEEQIRGVVLIPGSGEFVYESEPVTRIVGLGQSATENTHTRAGATDFEVSLDQLEATLPNARSVSLVVSWFGTDLRAAHCLLRPAVDSWDKVTSPLSWSVAGLTRASAPRVSTTGDKPAYGGTPSDASVVSAIRRLKERGASVLLTPFVLMDIAADNTLPDPYSEATSQPAYPWRGRLTVSPAAGRPGSPDASADAAAQIAAFVGTAMPAHFVRDGDGVAYHGPAEWSLRRMVLHYATLAVAAGGVDAFVIGSELKALTQTRAAGGTYPMVAALVALAADVKAIVGPACKVTYAADWSEYFGHHPADGTGDVRFHLDPLWASPDIDAIAIDCYWPLADWRDGVDHLDALAGARSSSDLAYLKSNLTGGEGFDWYYASDADRVAQIRTPITDGFGKPWVFRFKDLKSWWLNPHYDRIGGVELAGPTPWIPQSKPVWLTELGCPAVDNGANQPNVFIDPKSSESRLPHFSRGARDDLAQRRYLQACLDWFDQSHPEYVAGSNPTSDIYNAPMLDLARVHIYAWDARPFPAFPTSPAWGDGDSWRLGHWLNGRVAAQPLSAVVGDLLAGYGFDAFDTSALDGIVQGFVIDRTMSAREALQPLELAYFFDSLESGGRIRFRARASAGATAAVLTGDDLVETSRTAPLSTLVRAQETDLPRSARLSYASAESDYRMAVAETRRLVGASGRIAAAELPLVMSAEQAAAIADTWLFEAWAARDRATFTVPPSRIALEPGDCVLVAGASGERRFRITEVGDHGARAVDALSIDPGVYTAAPLRGRPSTPASSPATGPAAALFLDLPLLTGSERPEGGWVAALRTPWSGGVAFYRSPTTSGFSLAAVATTPMTTGLTLDPLPPGPEGRLDRATRLRVRLDSGALVSITHTALLAGGNVAAIVAPSGACEVLQFETAILVAPATWELRGVLRAQGGTEDAMQTTVPAGARLLLLDRAVTPVDLTRDQIGLDLQWRWGPANRSPQDAAYTGSTHVFAGRGLVPLSPVHIRASRAASGDLAITWIRRTRLGGDSWLQPEVPLAEESERYEVDILDGATVRRTIATSSPGVTYTAAEQIADFGTPQAALDVRVVQLGSLGRGISRLATI